MTDRPRRLATVALFAVLAVFAGAGVVGAGQDGDTGGSGPQPPAGASGPPGDQEDGTMTAAEFRDDIRAAGTLAEAYWKARVRGFRPVRQIVAYDSDGEIACGGQPLGRNNAAYCSAGDFIAYDVNWAVQAFRQIGDAFLFFLLGHEYAHGVQVRLGNQYRFTIEQELQADCMAGAYIGDSVRAGDLTVQEGDLDEFRKGLLAVGDDPGQPWFAEGSHGTAEQRTAAFFNGYENSLEPCGL
jgi:uncharacterized protein